MSPTDVQHEGDDSAKDRLTDQPPFRLLDLPPELWIRCCRFATFQHDFLNDGASRPVIFFGQEEGEAYVRKKTAPPAITRTCVAIRRETLKVFYGTTEFCFVDEYQNFDELHQWVLDGWTTYWPLVKQCTVKSTYSDVQDHIKHLFDGEEVEDRKRVAFSGAPPTGSEMVFRLMVEDKTESGPDDEDEARG